MIKILCGDVMEQLVTLPDESVQCCVTSPPYWGLRDYSTDGQIGLEATPEEYVAKMVAVFREVRRVLRKDGTLWLNLGDSYAASRDSKSTPDTLRGDSNGTATTFSGNRNPEALRAAGLKHKDLCGMPWRVALALQADGWWLRSDIIWAKPNPMPESVTDRPTKSHEYLFLLSKAPNYFYDSEAIKEQAEYGFCPTARGAMFSSIGSRNGDPARSGKTVERGEGGIRNKRSVWTVATAPYPEAHFATYPPDLIKPCILAGTSAKGCCAKCGAPWERQIETGRGFDENNKCRGCGQPRSKHIVSPRSVMGGNSEGYSREDWPTSGSTTRLKDGAIPCGSNKTVGWQPGCLCQEHADKWDGKSTRWPYPVKPCTVLDPFAGSGTTGAAALELGRKAILIELNPKYVELIEQRCNTTLGLALA